MKLRDLEFNKHMKEQNDGVALLLSHLREENVGFYFAPCIILCGKRPPVEIIHVMVSY